MVNARTVFLSAMNEKITQRTVLKGLGLSRGSVVARVCLFNENRHSNLPIYRVKGEGVEREIQRLDRAVAVVADRLEEIHSRVSGQIGAAEAEIFTAQKMILNDENVLQEIRGLITDEQRNAESAVIGVLDRYEMRLLEIDNEYIKERASDIGEIRRRILDVLGNMQPSLQCADEKHCQRGRDRIIVATELTPSLTIDINTFETRGFITERGGLNAHAAILARALGIPAVSGIEAIHSRITCGTEVLLDGDAGEIIVWPDEQDKQRAQQVPEARVRNGRIPGFAVGANINTYADAEDALNADAEGIGLYRTEFECISAGRLLSEDEQTERYSQVVRRMDGRPVTFRMLDIGGDKPFSFLSLPNEDNPALGWRGTRLLLGHEALFKTQARAIARAAALGPVRVMYPMIVDLAQFRKVRTMFSEATADLGSERILQGVMFEVPAACLGASELFREADFASVGSNDLIQYLFAVDRNNEKVAGEYQPGHPILWSVLQNLVHAAREAGKSITLCGEMAGDPEYALRLREIGFTSVSVSSRLIPAVRNAIHQTLEQEEVRP